MSVFFGLDFGTSNSALSVNINGTVTLIDIDECNTSGSTLKSILYFDDDDKGVYTGEKAVSRYIETNAEGRYMQSIKSFLPDQSFDRTEIHRKQYQIDDLVAIELKQIRERAEKQINMPVQDVVLGRPVVFSDDPVRDKLAEDRLLSAAKKAGFKHIRLMLEPIAAALSYEKSLNDGQGKTILVGDFGGGTSDFTVMKIKKGRETQTDRTGDILAVGGVPTGGNTFDSRIMWEKLAVYYGKGLQIQSYMSNNWFEMPTTILSKLKHWHKIPQLRAYSVQESIKALKYRSHNHAYVQNLEALIEDNYGYMLFRAIEKAKCDLSSLNQSDIDIHEYLGRIEPITQREFETIIGTEVADISRCVDTTLLNAGVKTDDVDIVFLTGGSSYIPCIKAVFHTKFGCDKVKHSDAFTSVAFGLGLSGLN
jgi:hypothetical chaperone protein